MGMLQYYLTSLIFKITLQPFKQFWYYICLCAPRVVNRTQWIIVLINNRSTQHLRREQNSNIGKLGEKWKENIKVDLLINMLQKIKWIKVAQNQVELQASLTWCYTSSSMYTYMYSYRRYFSISFRWYIRLKHSTCAADVKWAFYPRPGRLHSPLFHLVSNFFWCHVSRTWPVFKVW